MKNQVFIALLAISMFLGACSPSVKDMKDTEKKNRDYYKNNLEEALEKAKWCLFKDYNLEIIDNINDSNCQDADYVITTDEKLYKEFKDFRASLKDKRKSF